MAALCCAVLAVQIFASNMSTNSSDLTRDRTVDVTLSAAEAGSMQPGSYGLTVRNFARPELNETLPLPDGVYVQVGL